MEDSQNHQIRQIVNAGAGCGKTFDIVQQILHNYQLRNILVLTKMHSAKDNVAIELRNTLSGQKQIRQIGKRMYLQAGQFFTFFCTVESFFAGLCKGNMQQFQYGVEPVNYEKMSSCVIDIIKIDYEYNIQGLLFDNFLLIVDEVQDLTIQNANAIIHMIENDACQQFMLVGDALQNIFHKENIMGIFKERLGCYYVIKENISRRFLNKNIVDYINKNVDFSSMSQLVKPVEYNNQAQVGNDVIEFIHDALITTQQPTFYSYIIHIFQILYDKGFQQPGQYMIISPYTNGKIIKQILQQLEELIQTFWQGKIQQTDQNINLQYVKFHYSEQDQCINVKKSEGMTRILSIHSSKGLQADNVILINFDDHVFVQFQSNYLQKQSLTHVAISRARHNLFIGQPVQNHDCFISKTNSKSGIIRPSTVDLTESNYVNQIIEILNKCNQQILDNPVQYSQQQYNLDLDICQFRGNLLEFIIANNFQKSKISTKQQLVIYEMISFNKTITLINYNDYNNIYSKKCQQCKKQYNQNNGLCKVHRTIYLPLFAHRYQKIIDIIQKIYISIVQKAQVQTNMFKNQQHGSRYINIDGMCIMQQLIIMYFKQHFVKAYEDKITFIQLFGLINDMILQNKILCQGNKCQCLQIFNCKAQQNQNNNYISYVNEIAKYISSQEFNQLKNEIKQLYKNDAQMKSQKLYLKLQLQQGVEKAFIGQTDLSYESNEDQQQFRLIIEIKNSINQQNIKKYLLQALMYNYIMHYDSQKQQAKYKSAHIFLITLNKIYDKNYLHIFIPEKQNEQIIQLFGKIFYEFQSGDQI